MRFLRNDQANGTVLSITVAVSLFALSFGALTLVLTHTVSDAQENAGGDLQDRSRSALEILLGTPGIPSDWYDRPDSDITYIGLLKKGTSATLDVRKFAELRVDRAGTDWYENELKPRLDLTDEEFHLRSYPVFRTQSDGNIDGLKNYPIGYVGDYSGVLPRTAGAQIDLFNLMRLNGTFTGLLNPVAPYGPNGPGGDVFSDENERNLTATLAPRLAGFLQGIDENAGHPHDTFWRVINLTETGTPFWDPNTTHILTPNKHLGSANKWTSAGPGLDRVILTKINLTEYQSPKSVQFNFSHYAKFDSTSNAYTSARIMAYCTTCDLPNWEVVAWVVCCNATKWNHVSLNLKEFAGEEFYLALDWEIDLTSDDLLNGTTTKTSDNYWFLKDFEITLDAYGRTRTLYENRLDYSTTNYGLLVLGDGMEHAMLNDTSHGQTLRNALHEWVTKGGDIVAFGSNELDASWMAPALLPKGGTDTSGGLYLEGSDLTHAFLSTPHLLDYRSYAEPTTTSYPVPDSSAYTTIVVGKGTDTPSVLAVSNPNPNFDGNLVLTSWNLTNLGAKDSFRFLVNALAFARYNVLYLDYGAQIPPQPGLVASDTRLLLLDTMDPDLKVVETQIVFYVWRG